MKNKGFTLIELMIVIGLIGVIAFFAWANLRGVGNQQELSNTTRSITALLRDAQQRSITQVDGRYWGVRFKSHSPVSEERDYYFLFNSPSISSPSLATTTLITLKSFIKLATTSTVIFKQISGELSLVGCPAVFASSTIRLSVLNNPQSSSTIKVFCNGRIEF